MSKIDLSFEIFSDENFGEVKTIKDGNEIWFLAKDVAQNMGFGNVRDAIARHTYPECRKTLKFKECRDSRLSDLWGKGDFQDKIFINKAGVYCMAINSRIPAAEEFRRWIVEVVIPSIETNGGYVKDQEYLGATELAELNNKLAELAGEVKRYKAQWHAACAERSELKVTAAKRKKEIKALNEYAEIFENLYFSLQEDVQSLKAKVKELQRKLGGEPQPEKTDVSAVTTYKVDAQGFLI